jgi:hypothetical protein
VPGWYEVLWAPGGGLVAVPVGAGAIPAVLRPVHARVPLTEWATGVPGVRFFAGYYLRQGSRLVLRDSGDGRSADVNAWSEAGA